LHAECRGFPKLASPAEVRRLVLPLVSISHAWTTAQHPDPFGDQLPMIANAIERVFWGSKMAECFDDAGVFIDWCSLYQEHGGPNGRTATQYASFQRALKGTMDLWYSHQMTSVLLVTTLADAFQGAQIKPYSVRGWPAFERQTAQLIKRVKAFGSTGWTMCYDLAARDLNGDANPSVSASRDVPCAPPSFAALLETKEFTNGADKAVVSKLYSRVASSVLGSTTELILDHILCGEGDGERLGLTLLLCVYLERLSMQVMRLDDAELSAFASLLRPCSLPRLKSLVLHDNILGDDAAMALAGALHRGAMPELAELGLRRNRSISAAGRAAIKAAAATRPGLSLAW
jgi:hypothetical protein